MISKNPDGTTDLRSEEAQKYIGVQKETILSFIDDGLTVTAACRNAKVKYKTANNWRYKDKVFDQAIKKRLEAKKNGARLVQETEVNFDALSYKFKHKKKMLKFLIKYRISKDRSLAIDHARITPKTLMDWCTAGHKDFDQEFVEEFEGEQTRVLMMIDDKLQRDAYSEEGSSTAQFVVQRLLRNKYRLASTRDPGIPTDITPRALRANQAHKKLTGKKGGVLDPDRASPEPNRIQGFGQSPSQDDGCGEDSGVSVLRVEGSVLSSVEDSVPVEVASPREEGSTTI